MTTTCRGCRATVDIDVDSGRIATTEGVAGTAAFSDGDLVIWDCPSCSYPHAQTA